MMQKIIFLITLLALKSLYVPLNRRGSRYYWKLPVDDRVPLVPIFVIPYLAYYGYVGLTYVLLWSTTIIIPFFSAMMIAYAAAVIFWYVWPNGVKRPVVMGTGVLYRILTKIYTTDNDTNGFPSAHVFVTIVCAYGLWAANMPHQWMSVGVASAIVFSTMLVKQHYVLDVIGGIVLACIAIVLSF